jgi:diacylglycerol kinase family enzyme
MSGETFVIVNHSAARARAAWLEVRRELAGAGVSFDAHEARAFGDARSSARAALEAGYHTLAVVGGDGTLSEVVNGFFASEDEDDRGVIESDVNDTLIKSDADDTPRSETINSANARAINPAATLAVLPAGTGNDFARALEGQRASLPHWIARLIAHCRADVSASATGDGDARLDGETTRCVDVLRGVVAASRDESETFRDMGDARVRTFFCLNAVTLGVGAEVAARVATQGHLARKLSGETRFALAALPALARWRERRVRVRVGDEEARELGTNLIAVVNSRFAGGGMMFSPEARVDDGLLDVVMASRLSRTALAREMLRVHAGGHVRNPRISIVRATRVSIEPVTEHDALPVEADGDVRGMTPLKLSVVPRALRVVI